MLDIADNTDINFTGNDLEWIAENIEDLLQRRYDLRVEKYRGDEEKVKA